MNIAATPQGLPEQWQDLTRNRSGWFLVCCDIHYGDVYLFSALLRHFKTAHGRDVPVYLLAISKTQADVASMFGELFTEIVLAPALQADAAGWRSFFQTTGLSPFQRDAPILLHPHLNPDASPLAWDDAMHDGLTFIHPLRTLLRLPRGVEPQVPPRSIAVRERARALCIDAGMPEGRSVVLAPRCRTFPVAAEPHFEALAARLRAQGFHPFTSVAGDEQAVAGTRAIHIPFPLLPDVCEHAGWIVTVRSGVADIAAAAACRKTIVYRSWNWQREWGLSPMQLCHDAEEYSIDFDTAAPGWFADLISRPAGRATAARDPALSGIARPHETCQLADFDVRGFEAGRPAQRVRDVPPWHHGALREAAVPKLRQIADSARRRQLQILSCRDRGDLDFFEPIEPAQLVTGHYHRAEFWHSLLLVTPAQMQGLTHSASCLPDEPVVMGQLVDVRAAHGGRQHLHATMARTCFSLAGLCFLSGWAPPEPHGMWTEGFRSAVRIRLDTVPTEGVEVCLLGWAAALSPALPELGFTVTANRVAVGHFCWVGSEQRQLRVIVPATAIIGGQIILELHFDAVMSPFEQGLSDDRRRLGLCVFNVLVAVAPSFA